MADDLIFPRLVYRGEPDTLGEGLGETCRVDTLDDLAAKQADGWRLTRELPVVEDAPIAAAPAPKGKR